MTSAFTALFVAALLATLATRLWLARRQMAHVQRHRERVPGAFADRIGLAAHQKAADYTTAKQRLGRIETVVDAVVLAGLTLGGGLALLVRWTGALGVGPVWQDVALFAGLAIVSAAASLPFSWYSTFVVEDRFGFNRMTLRLWLADLAKGIAVAIALGLPLLLLALWLMRAAGPHWWLWTWAAWMAFQLLVLVLYPTVIAPLFNKFEPLPAGSARERIEALLARCGFSSAGLFVMDGSRRSAHELGHFKLKHIAKRIAWSAAASLAFLALLAWLAGKPWFHAGLGIPGDLVPAALARPGVALALFALVLPVFTFALAPLAAQYSRRHEFEADAFAARVSGGPALVRALVKLYEDNAATLTPDPVHSAFYDSHPPAGERVARLASLASASAPVAA